jgi:xylan 1,4-beta-xylosidase
MYAGVEFGGADYPKTPVLIKMMASSATSGGVVEVWLDSIDTGDKIAECNIGNTGDWTNFTTFTSDVKPVSGRHDVYLKFLGTGVGRLYQIKWFRFATEADTASFVEEPSSIQIPQTYVLEQNYPNPFNSSTTISYSIPKPDFVTLKIYDMLGREIQTLINEYQEQNTYKINFDARNFSSGIYFYRLQVGNVFMDTKKMLILR